MTVNLWKSVNLWGAGVPVPTRVLNIHDFPASKYNTANDLQIPLIRLKRLVRRSSPAVARQIENYIYSTYSRIQVQGLTGTAPDSTEPSTVNLKILYSIFMDYLRVERIKINRLLDVSNNTVIRHDVSRQLKLWLETQGWTFS
jgi:hypothetical protein